MINWKAFGYLFLGIGSVVLIWGLFVFLTVNAGLNQIENTIGQVTGQSTGQMFPLVALGAAIPHFIATGIFYVIGGVGLYLDGESQADFTSEEDLLNRLNKLEGIVDNNFNEITRRLEEIEEKNIVS